MNEYFAEEFVDDHSIQFVIIKTYDSTVSKRGSLYEAVRKYWKVSLDRVNSVPYVLGVINGIVRIVYKVDVWYPSEEVTGRYEFRGEPAPDSIASKFVGKKIPDVYRKKGMASPVLYQK